MPQVPSSLPDPTLLQELCTAVLQPQLADYLPFGLRERVQAYLSAPTANGWQPISTAPNLEHILLFYPAQRGLPDRIHLCDEWDAVRPTRTYFKPSHWMALPKGPTT